MNRMKKISSEIKIAEDMISGNIHCKMDTEQKEELVKYISKLKQDLFDEKIKQEKKTNEREEKLHRTQIICELKRLVRKKEIEEQIKGLQDQLKYM